MYDFKNLNYNSYDDFVTKQDLLNLSRAVDDLCIQLARFNISHEYLVKDIDDLSKQVSALNERNLKQDTIFALINKLWKISPYIIGAIFILTLTLTESSFDFSQFIVKFLNKFIQ